MSKPRLEFKLCRSFIEMWNDKGSGAHQDGAFYRTQPEGEFYSIGDYGQSNYNPPTGFIYTVREVDCNANNPILAKPIDFVQIVNDKGSGAGQDGSFWFPIPPQGYVSIGSIVQNGYDKPNVNNYRCIRLDYVDSYYLGELIYADHGSGAKEDMSIFRIPIINSIYAHRGYNQPTTSIFIPRGIISNMYKNKVEFEEQVAHE